MAQTEVDKEFSPAYAFTFPAMGAGSVNNASAIPNFLGYCSNILGCVRTTAGGTVGQPYLDIETTGGSTFPTLILRSSSATDTSVYTIYWTNEVASSQLLTVLPC